MGDELFFNSGGGSKVLFVFLDVFHNHHCHSVPVSGASL